jgi:hypothetical protein
MAESDFVTPDLGWDQRKLYTDVVQRKYRSKLPSGGYYFDINNQVFGPYSKYLEEEYADWESSLEPEPVWEDYINQYMPDTVYYSSYDPTTTFEGAMVAAVNSGTWTDPTTGTAVQITSPGELQTIIDKIYNDNSYDVLSNVDNPLSLQTFGKNLWQERETGQNKYNEDYMKYQEQDKSGNPLEGIPSRDARYDPYTVPGYKQWEDSVRRNLRAYLKTDKQSNAEVSYINDLRKKSADYYASKGYSPWHDAILALEANK